MAAFSFRGACEIDGTQLAPAAAFTALLFLEARDLSEAAEVAEAHPAIRYGSEVEVRPWAPPVPIGAPAATP